MVDVLHLDRRSPSWPPELETIANPPTELWLSGRAELLALRPRVAIVGTRSPTPYGEGQARRFASVLAEHGVTVVSGLARGIDQCAHRAALDAGGATVAVLGSGVDRPWPAGPVPDRVRSEGLLLSEFPPGSTPRRHHFPLRNRLISGLTEAVLVMEAAFASGSLITARWAVDQGRAVFCVPGRVDHPMARGCHRLLREGAQIAEAPEELLAELQLPVPHAASPPPGAPGALGASGPAGAPLESPVARDLVEALAGETLTADELARRLGQETREVLGTLVRLELDGHVVRSPGGLYRLPQAGG